MIRRTVIDRLVWMDDDRLATTNITPGITFYKEEVKTINGVEYRVWNPFKSKLSAAILKGLDIEILKGIKKILYLGASTGTTISHLSDILYKEGYIYAVEIAPRVMMEFINRLVKYRNNVIPLFYDARLPEEYLDIVDRDIDILYCDVAQPDQTKIALDNSDIFLKRGGKLLIAIKARSIDAVLPVKEIYRKEVEYIISRGYNVIKVVDLEPYEKEHSIVYAIKS